LPFRLVVYLFLHFGLVEPVDDGIVAR
jgi:hypothetical protein